MDEDLAFLSLLELTHVVSAETVESPAEPEVISHTEPISGLVTLNQLQAWEDQALSLRDQVSSAENALRWAEVKYLQFTKEDYLRELNKLEVAVNQLVGQEQRAFVKEHKAQRQELIDAMQAIPADHVEFERQAAELAVLKLELSEVEALIAADQADEQEATQRAQRYARQFGSS